MHDDDDDDSTTTASTAFQPVHLYTNTEFHCLIAWCRRCGYGYWDTLDVDVDDLLIFFILNFLFVFLIIFVVVHDLSVCI